MTDSILNSTKQSLGVPPEHVAFDVEILMHINSAFSTLAQLGVGPASGFHVDDASQMWIDFTNDANNLNPIKTYIHLRVKMLFDPPEVGFVLTAMKEQIKELEWRLMVETDPALVVVTIPEYILDGGEP